MIKQIVKLTIGNSLTKINVERYITRLVCFSRPVQVIS